MRKESGRWVFSTRLDDHDAVGADRQVRDLEGNVVESERPVGLRRLPLEHGDDVLLDADADGNRHGCPRTRAAKGRVGMGHAEGAGGDVVAV